MVTARKVRRGVVAGGLASLALAIPLSGSANAGKDICPTGTLCVWEDDEFFGQMVKIKGKGLSNKLAEKMNNGASSAINNRGKRAVLYDKRNGRGAKLCISPRRSFDSLAGFNDLASSSKNTNNKFSCPIGGASG